MRVKKTRTHRRVRNKEEALVGEAHEEERFPDGGIAGDNQFQDVVPSPDTLLALK
jgi:hypothetical protein